MLDFATLNNKELEKAISEIVHTPKHKERAMTLSQMFRDRPMDPVDNAVYWVEYVLRHDTSLMKPLSMKQTWWQRRLLDVYALMVAILLGTISMLLGMFYFAVKYTARLIIGSEKKKVD